MSGLFFKYLLLVAAAAMSGVTAFTVTPLQETPPPSVLSPEMTVEHVLGIAPPKAPFVPRISDYVNQTLADRREYAEVTRIEVPERKTASLVFGGDVLIHGNVRSRASLGDARYDFTPMFEPIRPAVESADVAICHLEIPLTSTNTDLSTYPRFNAPHEVAEAIAWAGFDGCSTASNHSFDKGADGMVDTLEILDRAGLAHAGTARTEAEASEATFYRVEGGPTVAHIAATYWLNGLQTPKGQDWMAQRIDVDQILAMAGRARWAGADLVVVSIHCCTEYRVEPTADQEAIFEELIRSPWVDLVVGHHSHVTGPAEMIGGEYVAYGLGNLIAGQLHRTDTSEAYLAFFGAEWTEDRWRIVSMDILPTHVEPGTFRIVPDPPDAPSALRATETLESRGVDVGFYGQPE